MLDRLAPQIKADRRDNLVIVASGATAILGTFRATHTHAYAAEPTTFEKLDWLMVPENSMICIDEKHNVLLYPIPDLIVGEQIVRAAVDACGRPIASVYS